MELGREEKGEQTGIFHGCFCVIHLSVLGRGLATWPVLHFTELRTLSKVLSHMATESSVSTASDTVCEVIEMRDGCDQLRKVRGKARQIAHFPEASSSM